MSHETTRSDGAEARPFPLEPTPIHVPDDVLADLQRRLELTRWPVDAGNEDWYYGVNRAYLQELVDYWRTTTTGARLKPRSTPMSTTASKSKACQCISCASPESALTRHP